MVDSFLTKTAATHPVTSGSEKVIMSKNSTPFGQFPLAQPVLSGGIASGITVSGGTVSSSDAERAANAFAALLAARAAQNSASQGTGVVVTPPNVPSGPVAPSFGVGKGDEEIVSPTPPETPPPDSKGEPDEEDQLMMSPDPKN